MGFKIILRFHHIFMSIMSSYPLCLHFTNANVINFMPTLLISDLLKESVDSISLRLEYVLIASRVCVKNINLIDL